MWEEEATKRGFDRPPRSLSNGEILRWGKKSKYYAMSVGDGYCYGDWTTGDQYLWFPDNEENLAPWDKEARIEKIRLARKKLEGEKAAKQYQIAESLEDFISGLPEGRNGYLERKKIDGDFLLNNNKIIIPLQDINGKLWTYQTIDAQGNKLFMKGGKKKGNFYLFGELSHEKEIYLCEGFATGYSIARGLDYSNETVSHCVAVGIDAGNLKAVCAELLGADYKVIVCADNDEAGLDAANACGVEVLVPSLGDFNDVHVEKGIAQVAKEIKSGNTEIKSENMEICISGNLELPKVHGLVGEIAEWITRTSYMSQPTLALGAALTVVGVLKGHKVKTETGLRTNLMILSVAPSGAGKDYPQEAAEILLEESENGHLIGGVPASGVGLVDGVFDAGGKQLINIDEMGRFLEVVNSRNAGGYEKEIITTLMKMFSSAKRKYRGKQYAKDRKTGAKMEAVIIDQPCVCINGATVPHNLFENMNGRDVVDGFLNRLLMFESKVKYPDINKNINDDEIPEKLLSKIMSINHWPISDDTGGSLNIDIKPKKVPFTPEARELVDTYEMEFRERREEENDLLEPLWVRASEHLMKLSLVIAGYDKIEVKDVECAYKIVMCCLQTLIRNVEDNVSSNEFEKKKQVIIKIIKAKGGWVPHSIVAKNSNMLAREYKEILQTLIESEKIAVRGDLKKSYTLL
jgi:hypothetical protein